MERYFLSMPVESLELDVPVATIKRNSTIGWPGRQEFFAPEGNKAAL